jgi:cell division inhibitor SepF
VADGLRKAMVYLGLADAVEQSEVDTDNSEPRTQVRAVEDAATQRPVEAPRPQPVVNRLHRIQ